MGVNQSKVVNNTSETMSIITFSNSNLLYWRYRHFWQPPVDGQELVVNGLAGGNAVKVGVIFAIDKRQIKFDLFKIHHGATLRIDHVRVNEAEGGVTRYENTQDVKLLQRGLKIKLSADHACIVSWSLGVAAGVRGVANVMLGQEKPDDPFKRALRAVLPESLCRPKKPRAKSPKKKKPRNFRAFASKRHAPTAVKSKRGSAESSRYNSQPASPNDRSPPANRETMLVKEEANFGSYLCQFSFDEDDDVNRKTVLTDDGMASPSELFDETTNKIPIVMNSTTEDQINSCLNDVSLSLSMSMETPSPEIKFLRGCRRRNYQNINRHSIPDDAAVT